MRNSKEINPNIGALSERFLKISIATKVRGKIPIIEAIKINSSWRLVKIRAVKKAEIPPLILVNLFLFTDQFAWLENPIKKAVITMEMLSNASIAKRIPGLRFDGPPTLICIKSQKNSLIGLKKEG